MLAQAGAGDVDGQDFRGVADDEIADPLGDGGTPGRHGVLALQRPQNRSPLGVGKAEKHALAACMREAGPTEARHRLSDITKCIPSLRGWPRGG